MQLGFTTDPFYDCPGVSKKNKRNGTKKASDPKFDTRFYFHANHNLGVSLAAFRCLVVLNVEVDASNVSHCDDENHH